jgi:hypothetical protein
MALQAPILLVGCNIHEKQTSTLNIGRQGAPVQQMALTINKPCLSTMLKRRLLSDQEPSLWSLSTMLISARSIALPSSCEGGNVLVVFGMIRFFKSSSLFVTIERCTPSLHNRITQDALFTLALRILRSDFLRARCLRVIYSFIWSRVLGFATLSTCLRHCRFRHQTMLI